MDKYFETFVVHVTALKVLEAVIHLVQVFLLAGLQQDKFFSKIPLDYTNYADVFSSDLPMKLSENIGINEHAIELIENKQPSYRPIYSLDPMELETLKAYIKTHLKTVFIRPLKSLVGTPVFFDKKPNGNFCLFVNY